MRHASLLLALGFFLGLLAACAADSGEFRPAKGATDKPPLKDAYRVKAVAPDCLLLGTIHAEGEDERAIERIASTAARHGANSYIVKGDNTDERVHEASYNGVTASSKTNHRMWAQAYRCPMSDDLPK